MKKKKTEPVVVRLVNETELFGYGTGEGNTYTLQDPLIIETSESETSSCAFLSRYNKFSDERTLELKTSDILYVQPMSDVVKKYYDKSLTFIEAEMDDKFSMGLSDAIRYMDATMKARKIENNLASIGGDHLSEFHEKVAVAKLHPGSKKTH